MNCAVCGVELRKTRRRVPYFVDTMRPGETCEAFCERITVGRSTYELVEVCDRPCVEVMARWVRLRAERDQRR